MGQRQSGLQRTGVTQIGGVRIARLSPNETALTKNLDPGLAGAHAEVCQAVSHVRAAAIGA